MKFLPKLTLFLGAIFLMSMAGTSARADIILLGPQQVHPAGVGTVQTVLSIQSPGGNTRENGGVGWNGNKDYIFGDATRGNANNAATNSTYTMAQLGVSNPGDLKIYFTINEPNGQNQSNVIVNSITLTAYNSTTGQATVIGTYTPPKDGPSNFTINNCGQGCSEYAFGLDAQSQAALAAALAADPNLRLGLAADISQAQGGPEHFFFGAGKGGAQVPEPATMVLLGTGLAGVAASIRKRRKASK